MANLVDKATDIKKFLQVLTWRKLIQLIAFIFIMGLTWATYENRQVIYGFANQKRIDPTSPHVTSLSAETAKEIDAIVEKSPLIIGMQIVLADFQKNQRIVIYSYIDDDSPQLKTVWSKYQSTAIGNVPLFSEDVANNKHLVDLINGEFSCRPFSETISYRVLPEAGQYINTTCANGIPASYGRFTGMIVVYLRRQPKFEEIDQIRVMARTMATEVYERDLSRR